MTITNYQSKRVYLTDVALPDNKWLCAGLCFATCGALCSGSGGVVAAIAAGVATTAFYKGTCWELEDPV